MLYLLLFFVILFVAIFLIVLTVHLKYFHRRYNGNPNLKYFAAEDFPGLTAEPISFASDRGEALRGFLYSKKNMSPVGLIIFSHGYGAGHLSYTTEINTLAKAGFVVLAYDGTACVSSDGKYFRGFDQGPSDLKCALRFAKNDERLRKFGGCVLVGHSWGGFTVMNTVNESWVKGAVSMCGFLGGASVMSQLAAGQTKNMCARFFWPVFLPFFFFLNFLSFGKHANLNSLKSLKSTDKPVLLLYGGSDKTVFYPNNGKKLKEGLSDKKNVRFLLYEEKGHNVYLTKNAEEKMHEVFGRIASVAKKDKDKAKEMYKQIDYFEITKEDESVMSEIVSFCRAICAGKEENG